MFMENNVKQPDSLQLDDKNLLKEISLVLLASSCCGDSKQLSSENTEKKPTKMLITSHY